jgi:hypothetical protein
MCPQYEEFVLFLFYFLCHNHQPHVSEPPVELLGWRGNYCWGVGVVLLRSIVRAGTHQHLVIRRRNGLVVVVDNQLFLCSESGYRGIYCNGWHCVLLCHGYRSQWSYVP